MNIYMDIYVNIHMNISESKIRFPDKNNLFACLDNNDNSTNLMVALSVAVALQLVPVLSQRLTIFQALVRILIIIVRMGVRMVRMVIRMDCA